MITQRDARTGTSADSHVGDQDWPDLTAIAEPKRPHLEPGIYLARSVRLETFERKGWRRRLVLVFEIHGVVPPSPVLAELPMYLTLGDGRRPTVAATSKLGRLLDLLGDADPRRSARASGRLALRALRHRLWRVVVEDVVVDRDQRPLHPSQVYSVVKNVVEHLA